jgi:tetratricopeptide (TPR) repeat protein
MEELEVPEEITGKELPPEIKAELRTLPEGLARFVSRHLVTAGEFIDDDPELALKHAQAANVAAASRLAVIREAVGVAAYRCQEYKLALSELRTARRISGRPDCLALIADCERALGRPEKAVDVLNEKDLSKMERPDYHELMLVVTGARQDLGQKDAGLALAKIPEFNSGKPAESVARLRFVYAKTLFDLDRKDEAKSWFKKTLELDPDDFTGVKEYLDK